MAIHRSNSLKTAALMLRKLGVKPKKICEDLRIPDRTLRDWTRKAKEEGSFGDGPGLAKPAPRRKQPGSGGNQRKVSEAVKALMMTKMREDTFLSAAEFKASIPELETVSIRTVQHILQKDLGLRSCVAAVKPFLTPANKQRRHKWAKSHSSWSKRGWRTVLFSDETHIEILADSYRTKKVRRSKEDSRDDLKFCRSSTKHPLKLMVWGCLGAGKLGRLAIIMKDSEDEKVPAAPRRERPKGKKAKKQKRVDQDVYIQVL